MCGCSRKSWAISWQPTAGNTWTSSEGISPRKAHLPARWSPAAGSIWIWPARSWLRLSGWSYIRSVDLGDRVPEIEAWLVDMSSETRVDLSLRHTATPEATRWSGQSHARVDTAAFE